jgi:hypothetical protein
VPNISINVNDKITTPPYGGTGSTQTSTSEHLIDEDKVITGVTAIYNDPNIYNPGTTGNFLHQTVPSNLRYPKRINSANPPTLWAPRSFVNISGQVPCTQIPRVHYGDNNQLVQDAQTVGGKVQTTTGQNSGHGSLTTVSLDTRVNASNLQSIINITNNIQNILNNYNSWYDGSDVCQRSCQLTCQVNCQVGCQSCNTSQCHNQNCGLS